MDTPNFTKLLLIQNYSNVSDIQYQIYQNKISISYTFLTTFMIKPFETPKNIYESNISCTLDSVHKLNMIFKNPQQMVM